ncbi:MAG: PEP-CTERM sorting domain-containing protein [Pseudomonadales bacterium]|nr:PEP-CTERM sorting domain-containing protein [Pseudomonadales bacterium]
MNSKKPIGAILAGMFSVNLAVAAPILIDDGIGGASSTGTFTDYSDPATRGGFHGQTFRATGSSYTSIGFEVDEVYGLGTRAAFPAGANFDLQFLLFEGVGYGDTALTTVVGDPGPGHDGWVDFDVRDIIFNSGQMYTAVIAAADPSGAHLWMTEFHGDLYSDGMAIESNSFNPSADTAFRALETRVTDGVFIAKDVPEPGSLALMVSGLFATFVARRKQRS